MILLTAPSFGSGISSETTLARILDRRHQPCAGARRIGCSAVPAHETGPDDAPLLVLVHGAPDRRTAFRRVIEHLPDLRVVTYDRRGYGEAADMAPATSLADYAQDLLAVLDGRRAIVVGHSFGGNVALLAATVRPELFEAVGIWESSMCWLPGWPTDHIAVVRSIAETEDTAALGEQMGRSLVGAAGWERLDEAGRELRRVEGRALALDMGFLLEPPFDLLQVGVPFVHGLGTETTDAHRVGARLFAEQTGVDAFIIPGVGHLAHVQAPREWSAFVRVVAAATGREGGASDRGVALP
jgi:pimeloyl-ACP methyl ester carboxylesterase